MRPLLILIVILFSLASSAQTAQTKVFKKTSYINGNLFSEVSDTIRVNKEPVDIYFYKKHFFTPYYLPVKFIDQAVKNKTISVWSDAKAKKDSKTNWENTYTYDSLGRVTNYAYSGCFVCSQLPYKYIVTYNSIGQVVRIYNENSMDNEFKFHYDEKGNLIKLEKYLAGHLELIIELTN